MGKSYPGDAVDTTITADIGTGTTTINIGASTGWPSGSGGKPFVARISDETNHEKVLVSTRTGTTLSIAERGYDGTTPVAFATGAAIRCVWDAVSAQAFADHIGDDDDPAEPHASTLLNTERHNALPHEFGDGEALGEPGTPSSIGTTASIGTGDSPAKEDHRHILDAALAGNGLTVTDGVLHVTPDTTSLEVSGDALRVKDTGIGTAKLADGAVNTDKLGADSVTGAKIGDDQIDSEHYVAGSVDPEHLAPSLPRGFIARAERGTDSSVVAGGATAIAGTLITQTIAADRRTKVTYSPQIAPTDNGDSGTAVLRVDGVAVAGADIAIGGNATGVDTVANRAYGGQNGKTLQLSAGSHTFQIWLAKNNGTSVRCLAGAWIELEDIGGA